MSSLAIDSVRAMIEGFHMPYDNDDKLAAYMAVYAPNVHWYDHAFHVCRVGKDAISGLRTAFLHCNQPFDVKIKSLESTSSGKVTAEIVWIGRTTNDIVRPGGQIAVKATGRDFECHVCMLFEMNAEGEITRIDEYYNKQWDDGVAEEKYFVMKGQSLKTDT